MKIKQNPSGLQANDFTLPVSLSINGKQYDLNIEPRVSLLDALREYIGLTGTKKGCNQGACGACTVLVDGGRINSCMTLAVQYQGKEITTVEGLAEDGNLSALQQSFIEHDGFQCGYCTPGQICSATAMIEEFKNGMPSAVSADINAEEFEFSEKEIKERMSGNLCRCGAYVGIVEAIQEAFNNKETTVAHETFTYKQADDVDEAIEAASMETILKFIGGGTNLVDLMRENIEQPDTVIDVTHLPLTDVEELPDGSIKIGALVRNSHLAANKIIREKFPVLSQAILNGASGQLRNMATTGGNIMQRTRCYYFYDQTASCNKRNPASGCDAIGGYNRIHAILGTSDSCIATHPSDMCVAMAMLDAKVIVEGKNGEREIAFTDFHKLPGNTPNIETVLQQGELIIAVIVPSQDFAKNSLYRKVRDRASYAFALVSVAAALEVENNIIKNIRIALGGVAHKPWRAFKAENYLMNKEATKENFMLAAEEELKDAKGFEHNSFKIDLAKRTMVSVLKELL